jgi:hypothetical protein
LKTISGKEIKQVLQKVSTAIKLRLNQNIQNQIFIEIDKKSNIFKKENDILNIKLYQLASKTVYLQEVSKNHLNKSISIFI